MDASKKLIVALDFPTWDQVLDLVKKLPEVHFFKVGLELHLASKGQAVKELKQLGKDVFLDLKFHDIPNTVAQACRQAVREEAAIFNVHAAGGTKMMTEAVKAVLEEAQKLRVDKPLLIAVTVLTSMSENDLKEIGLREVDKAVENLAALAKKAGLDGVVASPQEIELIKKTCGQEFKIICPGVRPLWASANDQQRIMTPKEAIEKGADYLVVGRPITKAENPREAALKIMEEIKEAKA